LNDGAAGDGDRLGVRFGDVGEEVVMIGSPEVEDEEAMIAEAREGRFGVG
jgi:hypothetical protein